MYLKMINLHKCTKNLFYLRKIFLCIFKTISVHLFENFLHTYGTCLHIMYQNSFSYKDSLE